MAEVRPRIRNSTARVVLVKVLFIVEQCNPEWASVPLEGFRYYEALSRVAEVTLVTRQCNEAALARANVRGETVIIRETLAARHYAKLVGRLTEFRGRINWPMRHALNYPVYVEFDWMVFRKLRAAVERGTYDVVHAFSPILPRYPVKIVEACGNTPFVLGPVNGGLRFPSGFDDIAKQEFDRFAFLRNFARYLPGYQRTYESADRVLAGSSATFRMLREMLALTDQQMELLHENAVQPEFLANGGPPRAGNVIRLLFVGRLVPYKCADLVIEAISRLAEDVRHRTVLTIVGDGPERGNLERLAERLNLAGQVRFPGWVPQQQTIDFYRRSDIFCFPSIREFGGAVVLEAMAAGLPCIVADYGGIAEYVTEETGFRIAPKSREHLVCEMARHIEHLARNGALLEAMSSRSVERASEFTWERKAARTMEIYATLIERRRQEKFGARRSIGCPNCGDRKE